MRHLFLTILITVSASITFAQNFSKLSSIPLNDAEDCKNAEPKVLECANYLLSTPCVESKNSLLAYEFMFKWMVNTPDYKFTIPAKLYLSVSKSGKELSRRYIACMVKAAMTNNSEYSDAEFMVKYLTIFAEYCENPKYKVPKSAFIKKLIKAKKNNTLEEFIKEESE